MSVNTGNLAEKERTENIFSQEIENPAALTLSLTSYYNKATHPFNTTVQTVHRLKAEIIISEEYS